MRYHRRLTRSRCSADAFMQGNLSYISRDCAFTHAGSCECYAQNARIEFLRISNTIPTLSYHYTLLEHGSYLHTNTSPTPGNFIQFPHPYQRLISKHLMSLYCHLLLFPPQTHTSSTLTPNLNLSSFSGTNSFAKTFILARSSRS
jgi:hypothetical protein